MPWDWPRKRILGGWRWEQPSPAEDPIVFQLVDIESKVPLVAYTERRVAELVREQMIRNREGETQVEPKRRSEVTVPVLNAMEP